MSARRTKAKRLPAVVVVLVSVFTTASCQDSRQEARRQVGRELAQRDRDREASRRAYDQAVKAFGQGRFEEAQRLLSDAVRAEPGAVYAWMLLGQAEFELGHFFEAAEAFDRAARLEPGRYEPKFNLGIVFESIGRFSKAIDAYEDALQKAPQQLEVIENLARAYIRAGEQPERARELIERALQTERRPEWRRWLGLQATRLAEKPEPLSAPFGRPGRLKEGDLADDEGEIRANPPAPGTRLETEPARIPAAKPSAKPEPGREPEPASTDEPAGVEDSD